MYKSFKMTHHQDCYPGHRIQMVCGLGRLWLVERPAVFKYVKLALLIYLSVLFVIYIILALTQSLGSLFYFSMLFCENAKDNFYIVFYFIMSILS